MTPTTLRPYPAYKPSGVLWLGDVPEHWAIERLSTSVESQINGVWGSDPNGTDDLPCIRVADFDRRNHRIRTDKLTLRSVRSSERSGRILRKGDLLLEKSGGGEQQPVGTVMLYDHDFQAVCSNFIGRMVLREGYDPTYQTYLHATLYAIGVNKRSIKQTTGIQNIDTSSYLSELVGVPPLPEQAAIVRYLDHEDRHIRRYISAKRKLIALLEEEKQAVVNQAVTRGLDPPIRLKPSCVEWLGEVPENWEVRRAKNLGHIRYGLGQPPRESTEGVPLIRATNVERGHIVEKNLIRVDPSDVPVGRDALLRAQEIIVVRSGAYTADSAIIPTPYEGSVTGYDMVMTITGALPEFMAFALLASYLRDDQLIVASTRSAQPHLNAEELGASLVLVPSLPEQAAIVEYLERATADANAAIGRARRQIELVQEYRTRLIADVVTGKVDVREAAAQLPDESDEEEPFDGDELAEDVDGSPYDAETAEAELTA